MATLTENPRRNFEVLRWMSVLAVISLPVTLSEGWLSTGSLLRALGVGGVLLGLLLLAWRRRRQGLILLAFPLLVLTGQLFPEPHFTSPLFYQRQCLILMTAGLPLLFAKHWFMTLARLHPYPVPFSKADTLQGTEKANRLAG